jgi:hypothetical protein
MQSMRNSRRLESSNYDNNSRKPRWKTLLGNSLQINQSILSNQSLACAILLILGTILFLTGLALFLSNRKGLDVLIVGTIMLLPGLYATNILIGTWLGWKNYEYAALPSFD